MCPICAPSSSLFSLHPDLRLQACSSLCTHAHSWSTNPRPTPIVSSHSGSPFPASVQDPGLHIWRVEKLKPVSIAQENHGVFFSGDSYLVLHNGAEEVSHLHLWIGKGVRMVADWVCPRQGWRLQWVLGTFIYHHHPQFILGQQSSRDEQGACAVLAVHLNTLLGERPVQHREVQGNESDLFMSYFPRGLKYQVRPPPSPQSHGLSHSHLVFLAWAHLGIGLPLLASPRERWHSGGLWVTHEATQACLFWAAGRWCGVSIP